MSPEYVPQMPAMGATCERVAARTAGPASSACRRVPVPALAQLGEGRVRAAALASSELHPYGAIMSSSLDRWVQTGIKSQAGLAAHGRDWRWALPCESRHAP